MSSSLQGSPLISYSTHPVGGTASLVMVIFVDSIGRAARGLSIVSETSSRPRRVDRPVPREDDVSIFVPRSRHCALRASTQGVRVDDVRLPLPFVSYDDSYAGFVNRAGLVLEMIEALQRPTTLRNNAGPPSPPSPNGRGRAAGSVYPAPRAATHQPPRS